MLYSTGKTTALLALLPLILSVPLPFRRHPLLDGGDGILGLGLGESHGPLDILDNAVPFGQSGSSSPLGGLPLGNGDGPLSILDPILDPITPDTAHNDVFGLPSKLLGRPSSTLHNGLLDDLLSPLTSLLDPATDALDDVLDLVLPTKLICADIGAMLLGDAIDVGICACIGHGLRGDASREGMWFGRGRDGRGLEGLGVGAGLVSGVDLEGVRDKIRHSGREDLYPAHTLPRCDGGGTYNCPLRYQRPDGTCGPLDQAEDEEVFTPIPVPQLIAHTTTTSEPTPTPTEAPIETPTSAPLAEPTPRPSPETVAPIDTPTAIESTPDPEVPAPEPTLEPVPVSEPTPEEQAVVANNVPQSDPLPSAELVDAVSTPAPADDEVISIQAVDSAPVQLYTPAPTVAAESEPTPTKTEVMTVVTVPVTVDVVTVTITSTVTETPAPVIQTQITTTTLHDCDAAPTALSILDVPAPAPVTSHIESSTSTPTPTTLLPSTASPTPTAIPEPSTELPVELIPTLYCPDGEELKESVCCRIDMFEVDGECRCLPGSVNNLSLGICLELDLCLGDIVGGECVAGKLGIDTTLPLGLGRVIL